MSAQVADYDGRDDAGALDDLAASVGVVRAPPSTPLKAGGRAGHVIVRVGPFMEEYEELARGHMGGGSSQAALITCERCALPRVTAPPGPAQTATCHRRYQSLYREWGRPFAYHARLLRSLDRREESRDVAAHALGLPLWSLGYGLGEVRQITKVQERDLGDMPRRA